MDLGLDGKVALITGASQGIGRAVAELLVREGCSVALTARGPDALSAVAESLAPHASFTAGNVTVPGDCRSIVQAACDRWGHIDILICGVGDGASVPPGDETLAEWQRVLAVNLYTATNVIEAARPVLAPGAAIVCISSICGVESLGAPIAYEAAKAALNAYVRGMARPLAASHIRLNAVAPGNVLVPGGRWDERQRADPASVDALLARDVALRRFAQPSEIANVVAFLASPRASFVTGAVWIADGGQTRS